MTRQTRQLSISDAAKHFNVSERTIRRRIKAGVLDAVLVKGRYIVHAGLDNVDESVDNVDTGPDPVNPDRGDQLIFQLQAENAHLKEKLSRSDFEIAHLSDLVEEKTDQIKHLRAQLAEKDNQLARRDEQIDHLTQVVAMSQKNIGALTEQLLDSRQMIEDMRNRPWWKRIKRR